MLTLRISYKDPAQLRRRERNPRIHTPKQIQQIAASIKEFGFINPVLIDGSGGIIAGHGRVEAAKLLGMADLPTVQAGHLTPAQIRAYVIADNRLAELAGWDRKLLALELQELSVQLDFDVAIAGFETAEVDPLIAELSEEAPDTADVVPEIDRARPAISKTGDLWRIGVHYLLCGNALEAESYKRLLGSAKAQLVFTDPPYNVAIAGHASGRGKRQHRDFAMASGEMSQSEFTQFLRTTFEQLCAAGTDGSIHFICMDWRHMREVLDAAAAAYTELKNLCVWTKTNGGMGSLYRSQHELVFVFKNGHAPHVNNVELRRFGRNRSNVWPYARVNAVGKERDVELGMHPILKPLALVADAILDCSKRGAIVLDAFAGSGTTLLAAERTGRKGFGIEIDPHCADTALRRFESLYGLKAIHARSNRSFEEIASGRLGKTGHVWQDSKERHGRRKGEKSCGRPKYHGKDRLR
jgi:DNA modification methylase